MTTESMHVRAIAEAQRLASRMGCVIVPLERPAMTTEEAAALAERLESHMGLQDQPVLLADCHLAAQAIRTLLASQERAIAEAVAIIRRSGEGWANVVEFGLILPQHRDTANILADEARDFLAKLTTEGTEHGQG